MNDFLAHKLRIIEDSLDQSAITECTAQVERPKISEKRFVDEFRINTEEMMLGGVLRELVERDPIETIGNDFEESLGGEGTVADVARLLEEGFGVHHHLSSFGREDEFSENTKVVFVFTRNVQDNFITLDVKSNH